MKRRYKINDVWTDWLDEEPKDLDVRTVQSFETREIISESEAKLRGFDLRSSPGVTTKLYRDDFSSDLQRNAEGHLLCKCPACGDEWKVATWPKLESDAKAQGYEEAMERVEEIERHAVEKALKEVYDKLKDKMDNWPLEFERCVDDVCDVFEKPAANSRG